MKPNFKNQIVKIAKLEKQIDKLTAQLHKEKAIAKLIQSQYYEDTVETYVKIVKTSNNINILSLHNVETK